MTGPSEDDRRCDSCGWSQVATTLIDFRDGGLVFFVCDGCANLARDRGCNVVRLDQVEAGL